MQFSTQSIPFIGKARRNKFGIGSGLLLILMGVVFIGASLLIMQKQIAARDWPTTTGQVSHVAERLDSEMV